MLSQPGKTRALSIENIFGGQGGGGGVRQVSLSPDGKWIAVVGEGPSGNGVYLMTPADSAPTKLWFQGNVAAWFPDSQRVVFSRQSDLWAMRVGSTEATQITKDKEDERAPIVSPDGKWIAFYSARSGHQDIWIVPSDGSAASKQLTQAANAEDDPRFAPAWSPDSKQIAYISNKADYWHDDVWVIDVASGKPRQLSKSLMAASTPVWSPDGKSVALLGTAKKGYWYEDLQDIWVIDALKGTERTVKMQITATDWLHSLPIYWSGDGQRHLLRVSRARRSQSVVGAVRRWRRDQADQRARHAALVRNDRQRRRVRVCAFRPGRGFGSDVPAGHRRPAAPAHKLRRKRGKACASRRRSPIAPSTASTSRASCICRRTCATARTTRRSSTSTAAAPTPIFAPRTCSSTTWRRRATS